MQNILAGNTLMLDAGALALLRATVPAALEAGVRHHDWWVYLVASGAGARIVIDPEPGVLYRQHEGNHMGAHRDARGTLARLSALRAGVWTDWSARNVRALRAGRGRCSPRGAGAAGRASRRVRGRRGTSGRARRCGRRASTGSRGPGEASPGGHGGAGLDVGPAALGRGPGRVASAREGNRAQAWRSSPGRGPAWGARWRGRLAGRAGKWAPGRRAAPLQEAAQETGGGLALPCDVTDRAQVEAAVARVAQEWGRLDLLFNNAGRGFKAATIDETPVEEWLDVVAVNLTGSFLCARAAFAQMRRQHPQGGRIINNGSVSAAGAAAGVGGLHGDQARDHGAHEVAGPRRAAL